ncbi:MAG: hypothetical protein ACTHJ4_01715 [Candidatus Nucleicultricaceae bacterium]
MSSQLLHSKKLLAIGLTLCLIGCSSNGGIDEDNFDVDENELPPLASLSINQIIASSNQCQAEVAKLWEARSNLPKSKVREFHLYIGKTSEACARLQSYLNEFRKAGLAEKYYQHNLKMAKSIASGSNQSSETPIFTDIENAPMMKPKKKPAPKKVAPASTHTTIEADDPMAELNPHMPAQQEAAESFDAFDPSSDDE